MSNNWEKIKLVRNIPLWVISNAYAWKYPNKEYVNQDCFEMDGYTYRYRVIFKDINCPEAKARLKDIVVYKRFK